MIVQTISKIKVWKVESRHCATDEGQEMTNRTKKKMNLYILKCCLQTKERLK